MGIKISELNRKVMESTDVTRLPEISRQVTEDIARIIKSGRDNTIRILLSIVIAAAGAGCGKKEAPQESRRGGRVLESMISKDTEAEASNRDSRQLAIEPRQTNEAPMNGDVADAGASDAQIQGQNPTPTSTADARVEEASEKYERYSVKIQEGDKESEEHSREKYYYVDEDGENIFGDTMYEKAGPFKKGIALVKVWSSGISQYCFINKNGENIFGNREFEEASQFRNGIALVKDTGDNGRWYYIKRNGENAFGKEFIHAEGFREGFAAVCKEENCYFIDEKGENAFGDKKFDETVSFSEGLGIVKENGKYYYIKRNGENAFGSKRFTSAEQFHRGIAKVVEGIRPYIMDKRGKQIKIRRK